MRAAMRHRTKTWIAVSAAALAAASITAGALTAGAGADESPSESPPAAGSGVATVRTLSTAMAEQAAAAALAECDGLGHAVTVAVVGRDGALVSLVRDDQAGPVTVDVATGKAYASVGFRSPSGALGQGAVANPGLLTVPGFVLLAGGLPISSEGQVIGAIGVSGAPGGDIDAGCGQVGIDAIASSL
jgi:uncharacterized protein GlcG (DUF336 family)